MHFVGIFQIIHQEEGLRIPPKGTAFGEFEIPSDINYWNSDTETSP